MALHIVKMCVGRESVESLEDRIQERMAAARTEGIQAVEMSVQTRMMPTRKDEMLKGGSLYWVIRGQLQARQKLLDIRPFVDAAGIKRCHLVVDVEVVRTVHRPRKAFQGWRYATDEDVPADLREADKEMPPEMRKELARLGLL